MDHPPVPGGDSIWMQQQNYSLEALQKRDEKADPFATGSSAPSGGSSDTADPNAPAANPDAAPEPPDPGTTDATRMARLATLIDLNARTLRMAA